MTETTNQYSLLEDLEIENYFLNPKTTDLYFGFMDLCFSYPFEKLLEYVSPWELFELYMQLCLGQMANGSLKTEHEIVDHWLDMFCYKEEAIDGIKKSFKELGGSNDKEVLEVVFVEAMMSEGVVNFGCVC